jgi:hypothetical protein
MKIKFQKKICICELPYGSTFLYGSDICLLLYPTEFTNRYKHGQCACVNLSSQQFIYLEPETVIIPVEIELNVLTQLGEISKEGKVTEETKILRG